MIDKAEVAFPHGFILWDSRRVCPELPDDFSSVALSPGIAFAHKREESPVHVRSATGGAAVLQGHHLHASGLSGAPLLSRLLELHETNVDAFLEEIDLLGGRWVLIVVDQSGVCVYHDAAGSRTVYYSQLSPVVASHARLLVEAVPHEEYPADRAVVNPVAFWDRSPYVGVSALLPNFRLEFPEMLVRRYFPLVHNRFTEATHEERLSRIEELWRIQVEHYLERHGDMVFSVTAGGDSRVTLAMLGSRAKDLRSFTYAFREPGESSWTRSLHRDYVTVRDFLANLDLNHRFLFFDEATEPVAGEMARNSLVNHGRRLIQLYNRAFPEHPLMHLRSNLFEIGRAYWIGPGVGSRIEDIERIFRHRSRRREAHLDLDGWAHEYFVERANDLGYGGDMSGYHLVDMYYWEVRTGRWLAECLNETDSAFDTFIPLNMREVLEILLSFDLEQRRMGYAFGELINRNSPLLNFYGKNDTRNLYEQRRDEWLADARARGGAPDSFQICDPSGAVLDGSQCVDGIVYLPRGNFRRGNYARLRFRTPPERSVLQLTVVAFYVNPAGRERFAFELWAEGRRLLVCDGATTDLPTSLRVEGLSEGDAVDLRVVATSDQSSVSWERASRLQVARVEWLSPRAPTDDIVAAANSPRWRVDQNSAPEAHASIRDASSSYVDGE